MFKKASKSPEKGESKQSTEEQFRAQTLRALKVLVKEIRAQAILLEAIISATPTIDVELVIGQINKRPKGSDSDKNTATKKAGEAFSRR